MICRILFLWTALLISSGFAKDSTSSQRLTLPSLACALVKSPDQRFLTGEEASGINPGAIAGTAQESSLFYSILIVDALPGLDLKGYAGMLLEDLPVANSKVFDYEEIEEQDLPVIRYSFEGDLQGETLSYHVRITRLRDIFYQQVGFVVHRKQKKVPSPRSLLPQLTIDKTQTPNLKGPRLKQTFSQTWLLEDGVFEHAGYGFSLKIPDSGYLPVHEEHLSILHPNALAGFENADQSKELILLGFPLSTSFSDAIKTWKAGLPPMNLTSAPLQGESQQFATPAGIYYQSRMLRTQRHSLLFVEKSRQKSSRLDYELASGFQPLEKEQIQKVWQKLKYPAYATLILGEEQSYSLGEYRNFALGIEIRLPENDVIEASWMEAGLDSMYQMFLHNLSQGWHALMDLEEDEFSSGLNCHEKALSSMASTKAVTIVSLPGGVRFSPLENTSRGKGAGIFSLQRDHLCIRALMGSAGLEDAQTLAQSIHFRTSSDSRVLDGEFEDRRMRFTVKTPDAMAGFQRITTPNIKPFGELLQFRLENQWHYLLSLNAPLMDEDLALELFLGETEAGQYPEPGASLPMEFSGLKATRRELRLLVSGAERNVHQIGFLRGTTYFSLFVLGAPGQKAKLSPQLNISFSQPGE